MWSWTLERHLFIKKLFEWYASGRYSLSMIRQKCIEVGFRRRHSEKRISRSNLEWVLKNPFYAGLYSLEW